MTRTTGKNPRTARLGMAVAAALTLTLTACGTEKAGAGAGGAPAAKRAGSVGVQAAAEPPVDPEPHFME